MIRTIRFVVGSLAAASLFAGCSGDISSPIREVRPRFSGGSTGGGSTGGGGTTSGGGTGGGGSTTCTNTLSVAASATEALAGNAFSATYALNACQSKTRVSMTATDLSTGAVVWVSVSDLAGTIALWGLPYSLTSYRIDATAVAGSTNSVVAQASTIVSTLNPLPCDVFVHQTVTVGYWGIYPAVWAASDAQDCGLVGSVHLRITNLTTGKVELDYPSLARSSFIDFEGPIVSYGTPYRVDAELRSRLGDVLATSSTDVISSPLR